MNTIYPDCDEKRWECQPSTIIADADNYYTKGEIDRMVESGITPDLSNYYTKEETDEEIASAITEVENEIPSLEGYATEQWVGEQGYLTEHQSLSAYSTTDEVNNLISAATDGMATEQWVEDKHYITGVDLSSYATIDNVNQATSGKVDTSIYTAYTAATDAVLSGKVDVSTFETYSGETSTEIGNKLAVSDFNTYSGNVDTAINSKAAQSDLSALTDVVSAHTANTDIHVTTAQTAAWNAKSNFSGSYNDLTDKPTIPTVPTSNSAFTNDEHYITSGDSVFNNYATTASTANFVTSGTVETQINNHFYCCSQEEWATISGSTQNNVLYLIY